MERIVVADVVLELLIKSKNVSFSATFADDAVKRVQKLKAVVKLQALYRGYSLRRDWINEDAAILIQSVYRGYYTRLRVSTMIDELIANGNFAQSDVYT